MPIITVKGVSRKDTPPESSVPSSAETEAPRRAGYIRVKRLLDIFFSMLLLPPTLVVMGACAVAIKLNSRGPVLFAQERPGYKGRPFRMLKLRTMIVDTEADGRALSDMERMTEVGRVLRSLSLDELPQLFNILRGDMSFIGPRPLLCKYLPLYNSEQMRRHDVLPGISGWAQVNGRNAVNWPQRFKLDVWYVDHVSARLDLKIVGMTLVNVMKRQGINACSNDTMREFDGNGD